MKNSKSLRKYLLSALALIAVIAVMLSAAVFVSAENTAPDLRAVSVSLDGQVNLKFKYSSLGDADSFKIHVYGHGDSVINASDLPTVDGNRVITVSLLPSEMGREVTVTPYYGEKAGAPERYSVFKYAEKLIASDAHAAYHDTARAMLNWGSFVERHFEQRYDDLPNEGLFADLTNPAYAVESVPYTPSNTTKDTVFADAETSLAFGTSNTSLKFYVKYTGDASALKARLYSSTESGYEELLGDEEFTLVKTSKEGFTHVFSVKNISVNDYATRYKLDITGNTGETATLEMSVLQYLNWNIGADSGTPEGEKNVCRSLYQLYQLAVGGVDGSCTHSGDTYRIKNGDVSIFKCSVCFKDMPICEDGCKFAESSVKGEKTTVYTYKCENCKNLFTKEIPNTVPKYLSFIGLNAASNEFGNTPSYGSDINLLDDIVGSSYRIYSNAVPPSDESTEEIFFRSRFDSGRPINYKNGDPYQTETWDVGTAEYFVIKIRSNTAGTVALRYSTTAVNQFEPDADGKVTSTLTSYGTSYTTTVTLRSASEWQTFVFNAKDIGTKYIAKDGKYIIDTFMLTINKLGQGESVDVEYFAVVNNWDEIRAIVKEDTVQYISTAGGENMTMGLCCDHVVYNSTDHWYEACGKHDIPETEKIPHAFDFKGIYYSCTGCGFVPACNGEHVYTQNPDNATHSTVCVHCGDGTSKNEAHTYITDRQGNYFCSLCSFAPECRGVHTYTQGNSGAHVMTACDKCGASETSSSHTYCEDENHVYNCTECKLEPACHGVHEYIKTETGHYLASCGACGFGGSAPEDHVNASCSDDLCDICGCKLPSHHTNRNNDSRCDRCNEPIEESKGAYVLTPDMLLGMTSSSTENINGQGSYVSGTGDNKTFYIPANSTGTAIGNYWINDPDDLRRTSAEGTPLNVGTARYIVIKYRSSGANDYRMHISTSPVNSTSATDQDGTTSLTLYSSADWSYYIIDAPNALLNWSKDGTVFVPDENGNYVIDTLYVEQKSPSGNTSLEFAFIAFAENAEEIDALIADGTTSVYYIKSAYPTGGTHLNGSIDRGTESVSDGKIQHTIVVTTTVDAKNNVTGFTTSCSKCGVVIETQANNTDSAFVLTPDMLSDMSKSSSGKSVITDENGDRIYKISATTSGQTIENYWVRSVEDHRGSDLGTPVNVGTAKYIVIKYRSTDKTASGASNNYRMHISTSEVNSRSDTEKSGTTSLTLYAAENWTYYIMDASKALLSYEKNPVYKSDSNGDYIIDTLYLQQRTAENNISVEFAFIAFAKTAEEINELIENDTDPVYYISQTYLDGAAVSNGTTTRASTSVVNGKIQHTPAASYKEVVDGYGNTVNAICCTKCNVILETQSNSTQTEWQTESETDALTPGEFSDGTGLSEAGASTWTQGSFASSFKVVDPSKAVTKTASEMLALLEKKDGVKAGEIYRVSGALSLESDKTYYGNMAAIIAEGGVEISGRSSIALRDLIILGSVTIESSSDITLYRVEVKGGTTGISIDSASSDINITSCAVKATSTAISSSAKRVSVYQSRLVANVGIISSGSDMTVQDCLINAGSSGIKSSGEYFIARSNTVTVSDGRNGIGIEMTKGSKNSMAALNDIKNAQTSIKMTDAYNCVAVLNQAISIQASNNKHLYVIKNRLGGELSLTNNNYLIGDGNTFISDGKTHNTTKSGNQNFNGDNMHDVNARLEFGADEDLLPHTSSEQFTNMEMRTKVTDLASANTMNYSTYMRDEATTKDLVIIPPGVYSASSSTTLSYAQSNTDIYAYGSKLVLDKTWGGYNLIRINYGENINISGFTGSVDRSTCGQVHILAIDTETNNITVAVSAGFTDGFYTLNSTDPDDCHYNPDFLSLYHANADGTTAGLDAADIYGGHGGIESVTDNGDGTYNIKMSHTNYLEVGDVMVTRLGYRGQNAIQPHYAKDIKFKDLTVYNISNSTTCRVQYSENVSFERYHSSRPRGYEITKEEFDKYEALETKYGVDLGVYYDGEYGFYRGPDPIWGASSCMEVGQGYTGTTVISSILHSTCDDGSNQRGTSGRLAGLVDNGDGTYTVYYKGTFSSTQRQGKNDKWDLEVERGLTAVADLEVGNTIMAYAPDGSVIIDDAIVLSEPVAGTPADMHIAHTGEGDTCTTCGVKFRTGHDWQELSNTYDPATGKLTFTTRAYDKEQQITWTTTVYSVTVDAKYINEEALDGYDLCDNSDRQTERITFDNVSRNSQGVYFDNVLIRDTKSRAILAKAKDVTIKHCTFRNLTLQALVLGSETEWAEGTVARNVVIENNLFDNCAATTAHAKENNSSYDAEPNMSPIDIRGLGTTSEAMISAIDPSSTMIASNFVIRHNKFVNSSNHHLICATGAAHITITENVFEEKADGGILYVNGCANVTMKDNTYTERVRGILTNNTDDFKTVFTLYNCKNIVIEDREFARIKDKP